MAGLRFADLQSRPTEFLDFTSLTLEEFQALIPSFEAAFQAHMAAWRLDGKPRTARRFTVYENGPLPTPEDRLLSILAYLKTYALQVVQGRLFGMVQSRANQWIHVLLPVLLDALRTLGDAPARTLTALAQRLGVSEAEAATVVVPLEETPAPVSTGPAAASASPLLPMTGPNGGSSAPKTLLHRRTVIAARKRTIRSKMFSWSMPCSRSSSSATPMAVASMISPLLPRRRIPCPLGAGCCRIWASWPSRCPRSRSSCRRGNPRGQELTLEQQLANQALHYRRLRIEHVNSSVKRCRIVKDRIRL
jgi:Helix-turn-helix of DDE superfamily endonuclease